MIRHGISLLEVILAIAILGGSLAALSSVVISGADAALDARSRSLAQLLCEGQMAQILLNNVQPVPVQEQPIASPDPNMAFTVSVESQQAPLSGLLAIRVTVSGTGGAAPPVDVSMVRWMVDPQLGLEQAEAEEKALAEEAAAAAAMEGAL